ncbi:hypothetical protein [Nonomuraea basaltis]|uniref:hypothetical protein n=1 Tax=Nonomuraea basaltis TaxID=2495887 RepID=UPI00110C5ED5|nr:hypothetical protein [Nonomuraea basaltis]TMS00216.1 hypothetical protein EJK15_03835 [Nonomuraea basaltis]
MAIREVDAADLKKGGVLEDGTRVVDAYDIGDEDGLLMRGRWIEFSDGNTGMVKRGEAKYRVRR